MKTVVQSLLLFSAVGVAACGEADGMYVPDSSDSFASPVQDPQSIPPMDDRSIPPRDDQAVPPVDDQAVPSTGTDPGTTDPGTSPAVSCQSVCNRMAQIGCDTDVSGCVTECTASMTQCSSALTAFGTCVLAAGGDTCEEVLTACGAQYLPVLQCMGVVEDDVSAPSTAPSVTTSAAE